MDTFSALYSPRTGRPSMPGALIASSETPNGWMNGDQADWKAFDAMVANNRAAKVDLLQLDLEVLVLDQRINAAGVNTSIDLTHQMLERARDAGLNVCVYGLPVHRRYGAVRDQHAAMDRLGYVNRGKRRYPSRGISTLETHVIADVYFEEPKISQDVMVRAAEAIASAYRYAEGREVVVEVCPRTIDEQHTVPIEATQELLNYADQCGCSALVWWFGDVTEHDVETLRLATLIGGTN